MNEFRFGFMKNVSSFFLYNTDMLSKQGNRISGNGKWNFLMEYIFQEEKGNEEIQKKEVLKILKICNSFYRHPLTKIVAIYIAQL